MKAKQKQQLRSEGWNIIEDDKLPDASKIVKLVGESRTGGHVFQQAYYSAEGWYVRSTDNSEWEKLADFIVPEIWRYVTQL